MPKVMIYGANGRREIEVPSKIAITKCAAFAITEAVKQGLKPDRYNTFLVGSERDTPLVRHDAERYMKNA